MVCKNTEKRAEGWGDRKGKGPERAGGSGARSQVDSKGRVSGSFLAVPKFLAIPLLLLPAS